MQHKNMTMVAATAAREPGNRFWQFRNEADQSSAELLLYGPISDTTWWGDEVSPAAFAEDLAALGDITDLTVRIYSYGGDVFAALAIRALLESHPANITVRIDGAAASAATLIAPTRAHVIMPSNSAMLVHHARFTGFFYATAEDMMKFAADLEAADATIINIYAERTGMSREDIAALMDEDRWMYAAEAVEKGFANELLAERMAACVKGPQLMVNGVGLDVTKFTGLDMTAIANEETADTEDEELIPAVADETDTAVVVEMTAMPTAELTQQLAAAREAGIQAERARQLMLSSHHDDDTAAIIAAARESGASELEVLKQITAARKKDQTGVNILQRRAADAHFGGANGVAAGVAPDNNGQDANHAHRVEMIVSGAARKG